MPAVISRLIAPAPRRLGLVTPLLRLQSTAAAQGHDAVAGNHVAAEPEQVQVRRATRWRPAEQISLVKLPALYVELAKGRLTALVVLSAMCGYALAPGAVDLNTLLFTTIGTTLCSASANSINQWMEAPYDAQMSRTRDRVLVRRALSPLHAATFGAVTGLGGVGILAATTNPLTAGLGLANILLYTAVYTPMKRTSIANTWPGSLVGAIPPLMGWAACTGSLDTSAYLLAFVLYAWQFPHFNALSWSLRGDYSKAGYRMASALSPDLNKRVAYRYSWMLAGASLAAPWLGMTSWWFALDSALVNGFLVYRAHQFYRAPNESTARKLFYASLMYLPAILALMLVHKLTGHQESEGDDESEHEIDGTIVNDTTSVTL